MAVEAMTMVTITGPEHMVEPAIQRFVLDRDFHQEDAIKVMSHTRQLFPFESVNPYGEVLSKTFELMALMEIEPNYRNPESLELSLDSATAYIRGIDERAEALAQEKREKNALLERNNLLKNQLSYFSAFNVELGDLFAMKYLVFHFGSLPVDSYSECLSAVNNRPDVYFVESGRDSKRVYGAYLCLQKSRVKAGALMDSLGFERMHIEMGGGNETVNETIKRLKTENADIATALHGAVTELQEIKAAETEKILAVYSWLRYESETFAALSLVGRRHGKFYLIGWAPRKLAKEYMDYCEADPDLAGFLTNPDEVKDIIPPPVKLKKGLQASVYEPFLEMYGLPAYKEIDPRPFLAVTYTLLFGIMFGDVGQGMLLVVAGLLLWHIKGAWLGRIIAICGVSATGFGLIYGSVFGNEELIPWGFHVLEKENTMQILLIAVALGAALLVICMLMNIINGIRQKNLDKLLFSPNGLAGLVFYVGLAVAVAFQFALGKNVLTTPYILSVLVLPLVLIFFSGPLTKLMKGERDWMPESFVMFIIESFFEVFETLLSYVSNTVSFLRVGAFAISHAGMMMVVYLLAGGADGGHSIPALIFGNIFVTALETMLVCIQVLRLEYYEMFGRFYEGGGKKFSPKTINYKAAE